MFLKYDLLLAELSIINYLSDYKSIEKSYVNSKFYVVISIKLKSKLTLTNKIHDQFHIMEQICTRL